TLDRISRIAEMIKGRGNCGLITASAYMVQSLLQHFPALLEAHIWERGPI
ncbi:MAG: NADH dehydrogenase (Quinone), partial [Leptospirillum sp. Group IV 'UBA BS']